MRRAILALLALGLSLPAAAQPDLTAVYEARVHRDDSGESLAYRLYRPRDYDPSRSYPLVVYLHGSGGRGDDNLKQIQGGNAWGAALFSSEEVQRNHPSFVVAPQTNPPRSGSGWGGFVRPPSDQWDRKRQGLSLSSQPAGEPIDLVVGLIDALSKEFRLDPLRYYVTGQSMGGYGAWAAISRYPGLFAAAAPICGGGDPDAADRIRTPVWAYHGDADPAVPVEQSRIMIEALKTAGRDPRYTELPGVKHNSWENAYSDPKLVEWMFAQRRP